MSLPYDYYPAVLFAMNLLSQGDTLTSACDKANITVATYRSYIGRDKQLAEMHEEHEQRGYDAMADLLLNVDNHATRGRTDPKMAAVISKNIMWYLEKKKPKEYGQRVQIDQSVTLDITITQALNAAKQRTGQVIEAEVVEAIPQLHADTEVEDAILRSLLE